MENCDSALNPPALLWIITLTDTVSNCQQLTVDTDAFHKRGKLVEFKTKQKIRQNTGVNQVHQSDNENSNKRKRAA